MAERMRNPTKKAHGDKLKNETSAAKSYRKKMRHGKKDVKTDMKAVAAGAKLRQTVIRNEDNNSGTDALNAALATAEMSARRIGYYYSRAKDKAETQGSEQTGSHYSQKMHARSEMTETKKQGAYTGDTGKAPVKSTGSNAASRQAQKNRMKREFVEAAHKKQAAENANRVGSLTRKFTDKAEDMVGKIGEWVTEHLAEHPGILIGALVILIIVLVISGSLSSCSAMMGGVQNVTVATSFTADDDQILAVEADYVEKEENLQDRIDNIESDYPGYDEYNYSLAEISHNPYELAALLTVLYEDYTESEVQSMLQTIFDYQYTLDIERVVETRTRTETRTGTHTVTNDDGTTDEEEYEYEVEVEYEYYILNVTLTNHGISAAVNALGLNADQMQRYTLLLETQGNKPDLFGDNPYAVPGVSEDYRDYAIPGEYMTDQQFANMIHEAKKYLGYPYVWGGSSPSTSFDCSGFVSYVINHCGNGWDYGRLTAEGWRNATAAVQSGDVQPGDLIFFQGTYSTSGASHVGIVVDPANKIMIHCGNPIQYASYDSNYWRQHFYCYGRIQ